MTHPAVQQLNEHMEDLSSVAKDIQEQEEKAQESEKKDEAYDPMWEEEYTFDFSYKAKNGKVYEWKNLTSVVPSIKTQRLMSLARTRLAQNLPPDLLDVDGREILLMVSRITYGVKGFDSEEERAKWPEWAKDLEEVRDIFVLRSLYDKLMEHESKFFRDGEATGAGA